ncbi:hypothetical protein B2J77_14840 [Pseudomonas parafulva]|uniref:Uncharacterized protein n=1 Tax=Pseudomonas parafulva TaxID=157782 RepID=A0AAJ0LMD1_9PSED|nr:hypothetical protein B2J77_14840 [Pseudomonas parafulva]KTT19509.1 hypothetical protein NS96R_03865 [Pseudomonas parafulva]
MPQAFALKGDTAVALRSTAGRGPLQAFFHAWAPLPGTLSNAGLVVLAATLHHGAGPLAWA